MGWGLPSTKQEEEDFMNEFSAIEGRVSTDDLMLSADGQAALNGGKSFTNSFSIGPEASQNKEHCDS